MALPSDKATMTASMAELTAALRSAGEVIACLSGAIADSSEFKASCLTVRVLSLSVVVVISTGEVDVVVVLGVLKLADKRRTGFTSISSSAAA